MLRLLLCCLTLLASSAQAADTDAMNQPFPAYKVMGNIHYVGTKDLAVFLITTPQGHILLNQGYEGTVPLIKASIEKLGFRLQDVKILLNGQAHDDHVAGCAKLRELTGAQVMVMREDAEVMRGGGKGDFQYEGKSKWTGCPVNRELRDGDSVQLGGTKLVAHLTPGHTKGCTTWTMATQQDGRTYQVVVVGGTTVNPGYQLVKNTRYPNIATDFAKGFAVLRSLPCDVFLGAHGGYYGMVEKYDRLGKSKNNPFIDPEGYKSFVAEREQAYRTELARQQAGGPRSSL